MRKDFRTWLLLLIFALPVFLIAYISILYFASCKGGDCSAATRAEIIRTPIPTLIPATLPAPQIGSSRSPGSEKCVVTAEKLLAAWVNAGYSDSAAFDFTDSNNRSCQATFTDVQPLFSEANLWYSGALACASCHNANLDTAAARMDLSSYAGMVAGAGRTSASAKGDDIFGGGNWEQSKLYNMLFVAKLMPLGRPAGAVPDEGPTILAGTPSAQAGAATTPVGTPETAKATPGPSITEEVARPSNPGGPGEAVKLKGDATSGAAVYKTSCASCHGADGTQGVANPGSSDGSVPPLNPIDPTLKSPDYTTFATNLDLFIQHGSKPEGSHPTLSMPAWGDQGTLTQQQIADVIAYIISLNP